MRFRIKHITRYVYEQPASHSHNDVRLTPIDAPDQKRVAFRLRRHARRRRSPSIETRSAISRIRSRSSRRITELVISSCSIVDRLRRSGSTVGRESRFHDYLAGDAARMKEYSEFLNPSRYVPFSDRLRRFFWSVRPQLSEDVTAYTERMILYVRNQFGYDGGTTHVHSTVDDILTTGGGVCQDFAHLSIGLLRLAGIPARYVSGYLAPDPAAQSPALRLLNWPAMHGSRRSCPAQDGRDSIPLIGLAR